ncbi:MAG: NADP-dependent phosphogluconate dehydrogenase, partial [Candidatus Paceibacteria bacterium]
MAETKQSVGVVGLGKMGLGVALALHEKGWRVVGYNRSKERVEALKSEGGEGAYALAELVEKLDGPRIIWSMLPAGGASETTFFGPPADAATQAGDGGLVELLEQGDVVVDAANAFYEDTVRRAKLFKERGIHFVDVGFSGGPSGARHGGSLMVGGEKEGVAAIAPLLTALAVPNGWVHCGPSGAGHFVKMVHNGIEYGMMQSLAEGFTVLKEAPFPLDLLAVADVYNHKSVIESRLVGWLKSGYKEHGVELDGISGTVAHTGEGKWTVET